MNRAPAEARRCGIGASLMGFAFCFASPLAIAQTAEVFVFRNNITSSDLPPGMEKRLLIGATPSEVSELLRKQPAIVLDGATLSINAPAQGSSRTIAASRFELKGGAKVVTHGINLEIDALTFVSDSGVILAFDSAEKKISGPASAANNGASGLSAGTVVLFGALDANNVLRVDLAGQSGQDGGVGATGPVGAPGPRGDNGADHLFDCAHGGGNGGPGSPGGKGGRGGAGGAGGDGGRLVLKGAIASQRVQVDFIAAPGAGGKPGQPGPGGSGGPGGQGGSGSTFCRGGSGGPLGAQGDLGDPGPAGPDGKRGAITVD